MVTQTDSNIQIYGYDYPVGLQTQAQPTQTQSTQPVATQSGCTKRPLNWADISTKYNLDKS